MNLQGHLALLPFSILGAAAVSMATMRATAPSSATNKAIEREQNSDDSSAGSQVVTLRAFDPIGWCWSLRSGTPGNTIQEHAIRNLDSSIAFDAYDANSFTVGIQGGETGAIVDIGATRALGKELGVTETVGSGQAWAAISMSAGSLVVAREGGKSDPWKKAATNIVKLPAQSSSKAPVVQGHAYLVRLEDAGKEPLVAKLAVIEHVPGVSVTFRWESLKH